MFVLTVLVAAGESEVVPVLLFEERDERVPDTHTDPETDTPTLRVSDLELLTDADTLLLPVVVLETGGDVEPVFVAVLVRVEVSVVVAVVDGVYEFEGEPLEEDDIEAEGFAEADAEFDPLQEGSIVCVEEGAVVTDGVSDPFAETVAYDTVGADVLLTVSVPEAESERVCDHVNTSVAVEEDDAAVEVVALTVALVVFRAVVLPHAEAPGVFESRVVIVVVTDVFKLCDGTVEEERVGLFQLVFDSLWLDVTHVVALDVFDILDDPLFVTEAVLVLLLDTDSVSDAVVVAIALTVVVAVDRTDVIVVRLPLGLPLDVFWAPLLGLAEVPLLALLVARVDTEGPFEPELVGLDVPVTEALEVEVDVRETDIDLVPVGHPVLVLEVVALRVTDAVLRRTVPD